MRAAGRDRPRGLCRHRRLIHRSIFNRSRAVRFGSDMITALRAHAQPAVFREEMPCAASSRKAAGASVLYIRLTRPGRRGKYFERPVSSQRHAGRDRPGTDLGHHGHRRVSSPTRCSIYADLTVDGTMATGGAVCIMLMMNGVNVSCMRAAVRRAWRACSPDSSRACSTRRWASPPSSPAFSPSFLCIPSIWSSWAARPIRPSA